MTTSFDRLVARSHEALGSALAWVCGSRRRKAGVGAGAAVGAVALAMALSSSATAAYTISRPTLPEGTTAVADPETTGTYSSFPSAGDVDLTSNAGQLWTDKSVWVDQDTGSTDSQGMIYGATIDGHEVGAYPVGESTFITGVSALTSSTTTPTACAPMSACVWWARQAA